jgi:hypothetical protein
MPSTVISKKFRFEPNELTKLALACKKLNISSDELFERAVSDFLFETLGENDVL